MPTPGTTATWRAQSKDQQAQGQAVDMQPEQPPRQLAGNEAKKGNPQAQHL